MALRNAHDPQTLPALLAAVALRNARDPQTLPVELFGRILELCAAPDDSEAPASPEVQWLVAVQRVQQAALVCKRWRAAAYAEPRLWRTFLLCADPSLQHRTEAQQAAWLDSIHGLLRRGIGQHVAAFRAEDGLGLSTAGGASCGWRMESFLALLHPSALRSLSVTQSMGQGAASLAFCEAVARLSQLTELRLNAGSPGLLQGTPQLLRSLPQLRSLELRMAGVQQHAPLPKKLLDSVCNLRQLTQLELHLPYSVSLAGLTSIGQLRCLVLRGGSDVPAPSVFPRLESYCLQRNSGELVGVPFFTVEYEDGELRMHPYACTFFLTSSLLPALLPPAGPPLRSLELTMHGLRLPVKACASLPGVTSLRLIDQRSPHHGHFNEEDEFESDLDEQVAFETGVDEEALSALLAQAPRLAELCLDDSLAGNFPACLADRTSLTRLSLQGAQLEYLLAGRYLEGLLDLDLSENSFAELPPALAAATGLTRLVLDSCPELALLTANLQWLLACLPQLRKLSIEEVRLTDAALEWLRESAPPGLAVTHTPAYTPPRYGDRDASSTGSDWGSEEDE